MALEWIYPAISGVGSVIASLFGANQQKKAIREQNQTNIEIARQTNEANRDIAAETNAANTAMAREANALQLQMMQNQQAFNEQQAAKERDFNSAQKQVQRLLAAGLNPHAVDNAGTYSAATSGLGSATTGSPSIAPVMQRPEVQAAYGDISPVVASLSNLASLSHSIQDEKVKNRIAQQAADTQEQLVDAQVENIAADTLIKKWENEHLSEKWSEQLKMNEYQVKNWLDSVAVERSKVDATLKQIAASKDIASKHESAETDRLLKRLEVEVDNLNRQLDFEARENGLNRRQQQEVIDMHNAEFEAEHGGIINKILDYVGVEKWQGIIGLGGLLFGLKHYGKRGSFGKGKSRVEQKRNQRNVGRDSNKRQSVGDIFERNGKKVRRMVAPDGRVLYVPLE